MDYPSRNVARIVVTRCPFPPPFLLEPLFFVEKTLPARSLAGEVCATERRFVVTILIFCCYRHLVRR